MKTPLNRKKSSSLYAAVVLACLLTSPACVLLGNPNSGSSDSPAHAAPNFFDLSFGNQGVAATPYFSYGSEFMAVAVQPDGKIVAAATVATGGAQTEIGVARYLANGSLDPSFGSQGLTLTSLSTVEDMGMTIALQSDGKILVGGVVGYNGNVSNTGDAVVLRYTSSGSLDLTFGTGGVVTLDLGGYEMVTQVLIQTDGKVLAAGASRYTAP